MKWESTWLNTPTIGYHDLIMPQWHATTNAADEGRLKKLHLLVAKRWDGRKANNEQRD